GDRKTSAQTSENVAGLEIRSGGERACEGLNNSPFGMNNCKAVVDPVVNAVWCCLRNVEDVAVGNYFCRLNGRTGVSNRTARNINRRAWLGDHRPTCIQANASTVNTKFADCALDKIDVAGNVSQWRSDPALSIVSAGHVEIDLNGLTAQWTIALERRIGQLGAAQL